MASDSSNFVPVHPAVYAKRHKLISVTVFPTPQFFSQQIPCRRLSTRRVVATVPRVLSTMFKDELPGGCGRRGGARRRLGTLPANFIKRTPSNHDTIFRHRDGHVNHARHGNRHEDKYHHHKRISTQHFHLLRSRGLQFIRLSTVYHTSQRRALTLQDIHKPFRQRPTGL